ncbi:MAG: hypothetical protein H7343_09730 [Undibacterium sp.]|nr:hypothetical protein [Opitutaceae bacterium]
MKTTLEIPDPLYRQLKVTAAQQGKTVRSFVNDALVEKLRGPTAGSAAPPAWTRAVGGLKHLRTENRRIEKTIRGEFSKINPEDWK